MTFCFILFFSEKIFSCFFFVLKMFKCFFNKHRQHAYDSTGVAGVYRLR